MRCALLDRPFLHSGGNRSGDRRVYSFSRGDSIDQGLKNVLGQSLSHHVFIKYHTTEYFGYVLNHISPLADKKINTE
jgi:hypothetical protein